MMNFIYRGLFFFFFPPNIHCIFRDWDNVLSIPHQWMRFRLEIVRCRISSLKYWTWHEKIKFYGSCVNFLVSLASYILEPAIYFCRSFFFIVSPFLIKSKEKNIIFWKEPSASTVSNSETLIENPSSKNLCHYYV